MRPTFGNAQRRRTADRRPLHQDESAALQMSDDTLRDNTTSAVLFRHATKRGVPKPPSHSSPPNETSRGATTSAFPFCVHKRDVAPIPREEIAACFFSAPASLSARLTGKIGNKRFRCGGDREPQLMWPLVIRHLRNSWCGQPVKFPLGKHYEPCVRPCQLPMVSIRADRLTGRRRSSARADLAAMRRDSVDNVANRQASAPEAAG